MNVPVSLPAELAEFRQEIGAVVDKQLGALTKYAKGLDRIGRLPSANGSDAVLIRQALEAVDLARSRLQELRELSWRDEPDILDRLFNHGILAVRASVSARTLLTRHTPTLMGAPHALDPEQNHRLNPGEHIIDYARNAYYQYQGSRSGSPRVLTDNPILRDAAESVTATLYEDPRAARPILFSSAMGAIDSLIDLIVMVSRESGQQFALGQRCWFEIGQYVSERYPGTFRTIDEHDTEAIIEAMGDPGISAIILEPLGNHPDMAVIDLERLAAKIHRTRFDRPKLLVLDTVHTPDLDVFARYFPQGMPQNLCLALVISGVKFLQAGWDISKSGVVALYYNKGDMVHRGQSIYEKLIDIRSVAARAPSIEEAHLANLETAASFRSRIRRYDSNTQYFAESLDNWLRVHELGHVTSPWLTGHERHELAMSAYGTGGRVLFVNFNPDYFCEDTLGEMFKHLAYKAEQEAVNLMAAPSFGLASPHVHIVIRPGVATTLRLSTGSTSRDNVERLLELVCGFLMEYKRGQPIESG